jgi:CheY-like chemotaxis protein
MTKDQSKRRILIVEDEGLVAYDLQDRLERLGYSVPAIASTAQEAFECVAETQVDLVLMDVCIKGNMDGIETAARLRDESGTRVVYLTAMADSDTVGRATATRPAGYVIKPVSDDNLKRVLSAAFPPSAGANAKNL